MNGNKKWEWEGNGNKTRLNLGLGMGMGINHWEWEGMGLKKIFPLISIHYPTVTPKMPPAAYTAHLLAKHYLAFERDNGQRVNVARLKFMFQ